MIRVLKETSEVAQAEYWARDRGLCETPFWTKNWDNVLAIRTIVDGGVANPSVFDAGCRSAILLPWLWQTGVRELYGCDLRAPLPPLRAAMKRRQIRTALTLTSYLVANRRRLRRRDLTATDMPSGSFDYVTSMSVIEHGVPLPAFFKECHRLLKPGGTLIFSTDYWPDSIDTGGLSRYNQRDDIVFNRQQIGELLTEAQAHGFTFVRPSCLDAGEALVLDRGLAYTFLYAELTKGQSKAGVVGPGSAREGVA